MSINSKILGCFIIALSLGLAANAEAARNPRYPIADSEITTTTTATTMSAADKDLAKKVQDKINAGWFSKRYANVVAKVVNGKVTLTGDVKTTQDKSRIEEEVRNVKGVTSVDNQIIVKDLSNKKQY
jgi:osmotically-inducible protein OsmY